MRGIHQDKYMGRVESRDDYTHYRLPASMDVTIVCDEITEYLYVWSRDLCKFTRFSTEEYVYTYAFKLDNDHTRTGIYSCVNKTIKEPTLSSVKIFAIVIYNISYEIANTYSPPLNIIHDNNMPRNTTMNVNKFEEEELLRKCKSKDENMDDTIDAALLIYDINSYNSCICNELHIFTIIILTMLSMIIL
jgi:hypothetical protein